MRMAWKLWPPSKFGMEIQFQNNSQLGMIFMLPSVTQIQLVEVSYGVM